MTEDQKPGFEAMVNKPATPKVGVGILFWRKDMTILLGKRKGSHGSGQWSLPGGHMEIGESYVNCCKREALEETGIVVDDVVQTTFTNDIMRDEKLHYVTLFFEAIWDEKQEPELREPDYCEEWAWFPIGSIPEETFEPTKKVLQHFYRRPKPGPLYRVMMEWDIFHMGNTGYTDNNGRRLLASLKELYEKE